MELLSVLPRGTGPLGFYEDATQRVPIEAIRLAADVPEAERSKLQVLRTDTPLFDAVVESRRNRRDDWYKRPAGHIDLCNITIPTREPPAADAHCQIRHARLAFSRLACLHPPRARIEDGTAQHPTARQRTRRP